MLPSLSVLEAQQVESGLEKARPRKTEEVALPGSQRSPSGNIDFSAPVLASKTSTSQQRSISWEQHRGTDCYQGKGGQPLSPDPYHTSLTLDQCQSACAQDPGCKGIIRKAGEWTGICYRRRGIQLANCVKDLTWDLFIKKDSVTGGKVASPTQPHLKVQFNIISPFERLEGGSWPGLLCRSRWSSHPA